MEILRKEIKRQQEDKLLTEAYVNVAFWREGKTWKSYSYRLAKLEENEYAIHCDDLGYLREIREIDSRAIVLDCGELLFLHDDTCDLESYLVIDILRHYNNKESQYNIDHVIKRFERKKSQQQAQPIRQKLDKEHFLQSVEGKTLINIAEIAYDTAKALHPDREYWTICVSSALSILHLLHYCYGVKYRIVINDDSFSIESQDGTDVLYTYTEKEI